MIKYFAPLILLISVLSGCAPRHFVTKEMGSLTFYLHRPNANRVQFAASFDQYNLHDAQQNSSGVWQVQIPVRSEVKYFYIVDGLMYIPECRFKEKDDFGSKNCLCVL